MTHAATPPHAAPELHADNLQPGARRPDVEHSEMEVPDVDHRAAAIALRKAWGIYFVMAALPPAALIATIFYLMFTAGSTVFGPGLPEERMTGGWVAFLAGMAWISVTLPLAFYMRRKYWHAYYEGGLVGADDYLKGNVAIWTPMVIAGVLGFVGLALTLYVASVFTSVVAFVIFLSMFPNGHAMTRPVGDHDDPGVYEEPK